MEALHQRQREWITAREENRALARESFMNALRAFNALVINGKVPEE